MRVGTRSVVVLAPCLAACGAGVAHESPPQVDGGGAADASIGESPDSETASPASGADGDADPCAAIEQESLAIRQRSCAQCHGPQGPKNSVFNFILDDQALVTIVPPGVTVPLVIPGQPDASYFMQTVEDGLSGAATGMPPPPGRATNSVSPSVAATIVYPTSEDVSILLGWIASCVPGAPRPGSGSTSSPSTSAASPPSSGARPRSPGRTPAGSSATRARSRGRQASRVAAERRRCTSRRSRSRRPARIRTSSGETAPRAPIPPRAAHQNVEPHVGDPGGAGGSRASKRTARLLPNGTKYTNSPSNTAPQ